MAQTPNAYPISHTYTPANAVDHTLLRSRQPHRPLDAELGHSPDYAVRFLDDEVGAESCVR